MHAIKIGVLKEGIDEPRPDDAVIDDVAVPGQVSGRSSGSSASCVGSHWG